ncbi:hypothetical protein [Bradyrhizobium sp. STM 3562]|uniref:hypothetical protein n=1 Tax=Bradyrhizobium sp. STM 3562 TaxID=578924 RepID=UPI003890CE0F
MDKQPGQFCTDFAGTVMPSPHLAPSDNWAGCMALFELSKRDMDDALARTKTSRD